MILDQLQNAASYASLHPRLKQAFDFLNSVHLDQLQPGQIEVDGKDLYVLVQQYQPKSVEEGKWEAHRIYFDVQYLHTGCERIDYAPLDTMKTGQYDPVKDYLPMTGSGQPLILTPGTFAVFFPQDAHKPGLIAKNQELVKKIVVKCRIDMNSQL